MLRAGLFMSICLSLPCLDCFVAEWLYSGPYRHRFLPVARGCHTTQRRLRSFLPSRDQQKVSTQPTLLRSIMRFSLVPPLRCSRSLRALRPRRQHKSRCFLDTTYSCLSGAIMQAAVREAGDDARYTLRYKALAVEDEEGSHTALQAGRRL